MSSSVSGLEILKTTVPSLPEPSSFFRNSFTPCSQARPPSSDGSTPCPGGSSTRAADRLRSTIVTLSVNWVRKTPSSRPGVAAADHHQLVGALVERPVAGRAEVDPAPIRSSSPSASVRRYDGAGRDERRSRVIVVTGRRLDIELAVGGHAHVGGDARHRHGLQHLDAVALGLLHEAIGELGAADPLREPGIVVEPLRDARLSAEPLRVDDQRLEVLPGRVDRRSSDRWALRHDNQVVDVLHRLPLQTELLRQLLVRGLRQVRRRPGRRPWG